MLTATDIHYLAAALLSPLEDSHVDFTLGHWIRDEASLKRRDVDITATRLDGGTGTLALAGFEVKGHSRPLSEEQVEGLALKMLDMPDIAQRAVISSSGFYKPAIMKLKHHNCLAYSMSAASNDELATAGFSISSMSVVGSQELKWVSAITYYFFPDQPGYSDEIGISLESPLVDANGSPHESLHTVGDLAAYLRARYMNDLDEETRQRLSKGDPVAIRVRLNVTDPPFLRFGNGLIAVSSMILEGTMQVQRIDHSPVFRILRDETNDLPLTACAFQTVFEDTLFGIAVRPGVTNVHAFYISQSARRQKKVTHQRFWRGTASAGTGSWFPSVSS